SSRSACHRATSSATVILPIPPGPVSVTSRASARVLIASTVNASRPTISKVLGRLVGTVQALTSSYLPHPLLAASGQSLLKNVRKRDDQGGDLVPVSSSHGGRWSPTSLSARTASTPSWNACERVRPRTRAP